MKAKNELFEGINICYCRHKACLVPAITNPGIEIRIIY